MEESRSASRGRRVGVEKGWEWEGSNHFLAPARGVGGWLGGMLLTRLGIIRKCVRKTVSSILNVGSWMCLRGKFWKVIGKLTV